MTTSLEDDHELFTYLDPTICVSTTGGCSSQSAKDRKAIFFCPLYNDGPECDGGHFNWSQVTAPEPEFVDKVNRIFGSFFRYEGLAGRSGRRP